MTITQTVEIPESREIILKVPREIPAGKTNVIIQFPTQELPPKKRMSPEEEAESINCNIEYFTKFMEGMLEDQYWCQEDTDT
jgi:hypothetical protein